MIYVCGRNASNLRALSIFQRFIRFHYSSTVVKTSFMTTYKSATKWNFVCTFSVELQCGRVGNRFWLNAEVDLWILKLTNYMQITSQRREIILPTINRIALEMQFIWEYGALNKCIACTLFQIGFYLWSNFESGQ